MLVEERDPEGKVTVPSGMSSDADRNVAQRVWTTEIGIGQPEGGAYTFSGITTSSKWWWAGCPQTFESLCRKVSYLRYATTTVEAVPLETRSVRRSWNGACSFHIPEIAITAFQERP